MKWHPGSEEKGRDDEDLDAGCTVGFQPPTRLGWRPQRRDERSVADSVEFKPKTSGTSRSGTIQGPMDKWLVVVMTPRGEGQGEREAGRRAGVRRRDRRIMKCKISDQNPREELKMRVQGRGTMGDGEERMKSL